MAKKKSIKKLIMLFYSWWMDGWMDDKNINNKMKREN